MNHPYVERSSVDSLWILKNFLNPAVYQQVKHEIRHAPAQWHSNYGNRHVSENGDYPILKELGSRLIAHLNHLMQAELRLMAVRTYVDFSNSYIFPHLDAKLFAVNVQLYMTDLDYPELGTQFCVNPVLNAEAELLDPVAVSANVYDEQDFFTVPFRTNWGYINDNRQRKIHKTLSVPNGTIRESVHFNYGFKDSPQALGLELPWFKNQSWYDEFVTSVNQKYEQPQD